MDKDNPDKKPFQLRNIATDKLTKVFQSSVENIDFFIEKEIQRQFLQTFSVPNQNRMTMTASQASQLSSQSQTIPKPVDNKAPIPLTKAQNNLPPCPVDQYTCAQAAMQMMDIRKYLLGSSSTSPSSQSAGLLQSELNLRVVKHIISTAIDTRNIGLIRLVLRDSMDILDFRALNYSTIRSDDICDISKPPIAVAVHCLPPDEFDWFSRDRLGKIILMPEACELFSIIGVSQCAPIATELYMNSRRVNYWTCSQEIMEMTADTLSQMEKLTTLVLRGMCDDYMLKIVGKSAKGLKHLDVSGSHFVTDEGLKNLFFSDVTENPATYLIKSFIEKNIKHMNRLVNTLDTLDYSWTNVTSLARKMVQHLPGAFVFKRVFAKSEVDAYGHHIFLRDKTSFTSKIPFTHDHLSTGEFEKSVEPYFGQRGVTAFFKLTRQHPWKNCILNIFHQDKTSKRCLGIITPNEDEKRVHGIVTFHSSILTEMYSVFPINANILGEACPKLHIFRGIVTDIWKMKSSLLPELTVLDIFANPTTIKSVLESVPNLKKVRVRIIHDVLKDEHILTNLSTFMCCRTLEELWIAPGSYKSGEELDNGTHNVNNESYNDELLLGLEKEARPVYSYYAAENPPRLEHLRQVVSTNANSNSGPEETETTTNENSQLECQIADLVHLTSDCIRTLLTACQKLRRIGDIAWWTPVSEDDLRAICQETEEKQMQVVFVWENHLFP